MALSSRQSRRDVLKLTAYSTAGALLGATHRPGPDEEPHDDARELVRAALRCLLQEQARRRLRKGERHQGELRGGERRQPADPRHHRGGEFLRPRHDRDRLQLGLPVRRQVPRRHRHRRRDRQGKRRLVRIGAGIGGGQRQVEGHPVRQHRPADELAHRLVQAGGLRQVPRHLGRASGSRHQAQEGRPPVRLRARPRLRRQSRLALSAAVVLRRPRGRARRQDHRHRFRRDRARGRLLPPALQGDHARGLPGLDRRQQQQGVPVGADLLHQQRRIRSCGRPRRTSPTWPR